jgi:hypothetical protein
MAYRSIGINIPEVEDGQVVSASLLLNAHTRYLTALIGESHGAYSATKMQGNESTSSATYATKQTMYLVHSKNTLFYAIAMKTTGGTGYCRIVDADDATVYQELTTTSAAWELKAGTTADAFIAKANGDIITLAIQAKVSSASYTCQIKVFAVGQQGGTVTWSRPAFTNATTSSAADFNTVRTALRALENSRISNMNCLLASAPSVELTPSDTWVDVMECTLRYRPNDLYVYIERQGGAGNGINWRVIFYNATAHETEVTTFTKGWTGTPAAYAWSANAIPWDGYGFTLGDWVRCRIQGLNDDTGVAGYIRRVVVFRHSDMVPVVAWQAPNVWAEGDTDLGNTQLDKVGADIDELVDGGDEELWGQSIATLASPATGAGDAEDRTFTGIHRRRWLCCKAHSSSETPAILYGDGLAESLALSYNDDYDWQVYDLEEYPQLMYGSVYMVTGSDVAFETTLVPTVTT